ncbi:MAG: hypothetical protein SGILL_009036 [Bacillariaceae sp.]
MFPPSSVKAPTPFGGSKAAASKPLTAVAAFPPSSSKPPIPFGGGGGGGGAVEKDYRARLVNFYKKHNPSKLNTVDATLEKYKGKEDDLFQKLQAKYEGEAAPKFPMPSGEGPVCYIEFSVDGEKAGRVAVKLYEDRVPLASENFKCLCTGEKGMGRLGKPLCYKGSKVHRIVPNFCVQMGDFTKGDGTGGVSIYPPNSEHGDAWGKFKDEEFMQHSKAGLLSMANSGKNTNSSQVFFTLRPVSNLDGKHVVFGEVVEGMDVIEALGQLQTNQKQNPVKQVVISGCGEVRDGKDVPCKEEKQSGPFGASTSGLASTTNPSPFGKLSPLAPSAFGASGTATATNLSTFGKPAQSVFGSMGKAAAPSGVPFSFGQTSTLGFGASTTAAASSAGAFAFGQAPTPAFGSTSAGDSLTTFSSPFGSGVQDSTRDSASVPPIFSFVDKKSTPSFGSLAATQKKDGAQPFKFGGN